MNIGLIRNRNHNAFLCCGNCAHYSNYWVNHGEKEVPKKAICREWLLRMTKKIVDTQQFCDYFKPARRFDGKKYNWTRN